MLSKIHSLLAITKYRVIIGAIVVFTIAGGTGIVLTRQWSSKNGDPAQADKTTTSTQLAPGRTSTSTAETKKKTTTPAPSSPTAQKPSSTTAGTPASPSSPPVSNPPSSPPTGSCSGAAWNPDASDPWGGCWPGPNNTGVPSGVVLSSYTGPCTITVANTTIDAKTVNCILSIRAANVQITRSQINGGVDVPSDAPASASFAISDSSIYIGDNLNTGLMRRNFTANRVDIVGGRRSVYCASSCTVENSWVHAQGGDPNGVAHFSGMRMEQYTTYRHNSITCEANRVPGSGCSAGLTGYGDFAPVQNNLIERNLFYRGGNGGSTACAYGGSSGDDGSKPYGSQAMNIRFISNRFVRSDNGLCGNLRTIIDFNPSRPGNVWTDNLYHDGSVIAATGP